VPKRGTMRSLLLAAACLILFATAVAWRPAEGLAVNCAAVRSSCVAACNNRETTQAGIQACSNRCSTILPGYCDRMPPGRSAGLQRRLQLLQWGLRCFGGNPIRRRHPESNGLLQPLLQAVQGLSRPASLRHKHDRLPIGRSASICALSAPSPLLKSRGNAPKPNGLTLPST
jgi:hypothetical protein